MVKLIPGGKLIAANPADIDWDRINDHDGRLFRECVRHVCPCPDCQRERQDQAAIDATPPADEL